MRLDENIFNLITTAVDTARVLSIEDIIIDKTGIRALHPERISVILFNGDLQLPFESIGLNRLPVFQQRVNIVKDMENITIDAELDNDQDVRSLKFKGKGLTVSYRCAKKETISAPKSLSENFFRQVMFSEEAMTMLSKGQNAMKADVFTLISDDKGVRFEILDSNSDVFTYQFADKIDLKNVDTSQTFVYRYPIKVFLPILKYAGHSATDLQIGEKGVLKMVINGLDVMILPRK